MVMTTFELEKTLQMLDRVLGVLEHRHYPLEAEERHLRRRLEERRGGLRALIAARNAEREKKIVRFALWQDDTLPAPSLALEPGADAM
jgi:hypothetical protein